MESDRIAGDRFMLDAPAVGPRDRELDFFVACRDAELVCETSYGRYRYARDLCGPFGRVLLEPFHQKLKRRFCGFAVRHAKLAREIRIGTGGVGDYGPV